ncbi:MAG: UpxY family transcription antiterminator [Rikenellaceae bacterium]|nr:UpxY family transcription antiterminator [Rikenellaceae bacterium]
MSDTIWFAMRATYGRNLMAQRLLEIKKIESFIPMRKRTTKVGHRIKTDYIPVVRDLIFVLCEREVIQEAKSKIPYLHYITRPAEGRNIPVEVPTEQMENFMAVCNDMETDVEFLSGEEARFEVGEWVRICRGSLKGREGRLVKVEGKRSKRFVVAIDGVLAVSVSGIKADDIERIKN